MSTKFSSAALTKELNLEAFHKEMQRVRQTTKRDVTMKQYLDDTWPGTTPEKFYETLGIDLRNLTVDKILNTGELSRWMFPEIIRDAIRRGLEYTPFYTKLITGEETIQSTGVTMPLMDYRLVDPNVFRLRDVQEGATIPESEAIIWTEKQVTIHKQARGLKQTYESIQFTPINLAAIYFEELGARLGADLDRNLINIAINGDQADGSQSAYVMGSTTGTTLQYIDVARVWTRMKRMFRNSTVMLCSEADALTLLNTSQFQRTIFPGAVPLSGVTLNVSTPLPSYQDIYIHDAVPTGTIVFIDVARSFIQLTAQPLLTESDRIISRQLNETFVSMITGFANIFRDGRLVLSYLTTLGTNPGPTIFS